MSLEQQRKGGGPGAGVGEEEMVKPEFFFLIENFSKVRYQGLFKLPWFHLDCSLFPFECEAWNGGKHGKCLPFCLLYLFYCKA